MLYLGEVVILQVPRIQKVPVQGNKTGVPLPECCWEEAENHRNENKSDFQEPWRMLLESVLMSGSMWRHFSVTKSWPYSG